MACFLTLAGCGDIKVSISRQSKVVNVTASSNSRPKICWSIGEDVKKLGEIRKFSLFMAKGDKTIWNLTNIPGDVRSVKYGKLPKDTTGSYPPDLTPGEYSIKVTAIGPVSAIGSGEATLTVK
jgi:hypothetical protein